MLSSVFKMFDLRKNSFSILINYINNCIRCKNRISFSEFERYIGKEDMILNC